jgi:hypothetical protein
MGTRLQYFAIVGALVLLGVLLELVRRRRLMERYALLWLFSAAILLALASWPAGLARLSHAVGIYYPPNALFVVGLAFVLVLLLHFSLAVSRLTDQTKVLAQRVALLEDRLRHHEEQSESDERLSDGVAGDAGEEDPMRTVGLGAHRS